MPYYLITQTSLVEGEDEVKAAQKALAKLKSDSSVDFTVKFDEENIRYVTVPNLALPETAPPVADNPAASAAGSPENLAKGAPTVDKADVSKLQALSAKGIIFGLSLFAVGASEALRPKEFAPSRQACTFVFGCWRISPYP